MTTDEAVAILRELRPQVGMLEAKHGDALDALVARITDLEARQPYIDGTRPLTDSEYAAQQAVLIAAEERAHELEALEAQTARQRDGYAERAVAAEAALATARQALTEIEEATMDSASQLRRRARRALAATGEGA